MKYLFLTALLVSGFAGAMAQNTTTRQDTTVTKSGKTKKFDMSHGVGVMIGKKDSTGTTNASKGRFIGGITLTRLDIGFAKLIDNGSFSLAPENEFLDYKAGKTSTVSLDVVQMGYRFNSNFKIYVAGGFDWTHIRLKKNITMKKNSPVLDYDTESITFSKNRFSSFYVHIPLNFELRTKENDNGKRFYFVFGPEIAFLTNAKVKQVSKEKGKEKFNDDYNFQPFRYGGTLRLGYGGLGIFTKYYFNDMFDSTPHKGLKNMSFGLTLGLN
ncbi:outer membrane beta-barrel protein [Pedobacter heparinus]|uniref:outer membrane beta-barrel protein n=1 Tax=Pedobacter heparinus TaxID=984 RepID=UPI002931C018|nr:outer membrane beta-barrel protein [Pedobacter heparinus]